MTATTIRIAVELPLADVLSTGLVAQLQDTHLDQEGGLRRDSAWDPGRNGPLIGTWELLGDDEPR